MPSLWYQCNQTTYCYNTLRTPYTYIGQTRNTLSRCLKCHLSDTSAIKQHIATTPCEPLTPILARQETPCLVVLSAISLIPVPSNNILLQHLANPLHLYWPDKKHPVSLSWVLSLWYQCNQTTYGYNTLRTPYTYIGQTRNTLSRCLKCHLSDTGAIKQHMVTTPCEPLTPILARQETPCLVVLSAISLIPVPSNNILLQHLANPLHLYWPDKKHPVSLS